MGYYRCGKEGYIRKNLSLLKFYFMPVISCLVGLGVMYVRLDLRFNHV